MFSIFSGCCAYHGFFINNKNQLFGFGSNDYGQLGVGRSGSGEKTPLLIPSSCLSSRVQMKNIACGRRHSIFVSRDGQAFSCGDNDDGRLALGSSRDYDFPAQITLLDKGKLQKISRCFVGAFCTFLVTNSGTVYAAGYNHYGKPFYGIQKIGQLGVGDRENKENAVEVTALKNEYVVNISCGWDFTIFTTRSGKFFACGDNSFGQLPTIQRKENALDDGYSLGGGSNIVMLAELINLPFKARKVVATCHSTYFITSEGVIGCGCNDEGEMGTVDDLRKAKSVNELAKVGTIKARAMSGGSGFIVFLTDNGVFGLGKNEFNQIQRGKNAEKNFVKPVKMMEHIVQVAAGYGQLYFVNSKGTLFVQGYNDICEGCLVGENYPKEGIYLRRDSSVGFKEFDVDWKERFHFLVDFGQNRFLFELTCAVMRK